MKHKPLERILAAALLVASAPAPAQEEPQAKDVLANLKYRSIAVGPSDPNVVYVGSGEANIRGDVPHVTPPR